MPFNSYGFPYGSNASHPFREPRPKSKFGFHGGEDRPAAAGTPVPAQFDGKVFRSGPIDGYGNAVVVESTAPNGRKFHTLYGHLGPDGLPAVGDDVKAGKSLLGNVGTEAFVNSFPYADIHGTHLHWEIISDKAGLHQNGSLGIYSSDTTHRANPDTFDINNPFFPYEGEVPLSRPRPDLGDRPSDNQPSTPPTASPADASSNFDDRFSAVYSDTPSGRSDGLNGSPSVGTGNFVRQSIPFVSRPAGSWDSPGEPSFLNPAPMNPEANAPFATGGQFISGSTSSRTLYPTGSFIAPNTLTPPSQNPFGNGVGSWLSTITPATPLYAAPPADQPGGLTDMILDYLRHNQRSALAGPTQAAAASQLPDASQELPPLQPDETQGAADNRPRRFLGRRTYSLSDPSPFPQRSSIAAASESPDESLSLNDAHLEYLRRLNASLA